MQISSKEIVFLISIITFIFLAIPLFLISYIRLYNQRKKKHSEEKELLKQVFENELLRSQMEVQEQTLKTVACDLHDNIGQLLGLTVITLSAVNLENPAKAAERIAAAEELTKRSVKAIRALSRLLHGEKLLSEGLAAAIAFELEWLEKSDVYKISYNHDVTAMPARPDQEIIVFRLFQEILNNIIKHAQATKISVILSVSAELLTLTLEDNGIGFKMEEITRQNKGMGLHNIHKRVEMIRGDAAIDSVPGTGTKITITIPH